MRIRNIIILIIFTLTVSIVSSCNDTKVNKYENENLWAFKDVEREEKVDTFFLAPAATTGSEDVPSLEFDNEKNMSKFLGSVKMQKGIYDEETRFFAPYYREAFMYVYTLTEEEKNRYLDIAYSDVKEAFEYYLENFNNGNKIIIAGFSEGANMSLRLLKDFIDNDDFYDKLIACYAIGDIVTDDYLNSNDRLAIAEGEIDQKVIISFNCEAVETTSSMFVLENQKSNAINPLSWSRNNEVADKSLNKGAVFLDTYGNIVSEIPEFTGCYIDETRGTLKVLDVVKEDYNGMKDFFGDGSYHLYDYQFFYNNLKENVIKRINNH